LRSVQAIGRETHATHAAVWANRDGTIRLVREDVGRHCALDKLVGAGMREAFDFADGFAVVTSRCSLEMVQKAVAAGISTLVAVSAPTALAVRTAAASGLNLIASARGDSHLVFHGGEP
jgi:FdhD protein